MAAGIAAAKNWPEYSSKSAGDKPVGPRTVYIDFVVESGESVDVAELASLTTGIKLAQRLMDMPPCELNTRYSVYLKLK